MDNVKKYLFRGIVVAVLMIISGFSGFKLNQYLVQIKDGTMETITSVAVVNLDSGVIQGKEVINYGSHLIHTSANGFVIVGLEDARIGIESGKYAAYIVIPSTFSEHVISLNTTPKKAEIQYEINPRLRTDIRENIIYKILQFENDLKNDLGYMYVSAVLGEFHTTQDYAKEILLNDKKDLEVLQGIKEIDLVNAIDIEELEFYEENIADLDLAEDHRSNEQLIGSFQKQYEEYISLTKEDLDNLKLRSSDIYNDSEIVDKLWSMGEFKDTKGTYVYADGEEGVRSDLSIYNSNLEEDKDHLKIAVTDYVDELQTEGNHQLDQILGVSVDDSFIPSVDSIKMKFQLFKNEVRVLTRAEMLKVVESVTNTESEGMVSEIVREELKEEIEAIAREELIKAFDEVSLDYPGNPTFEGVKSKILLSFGTSEDYDTGSKETVDTFLVLIQEALEVRIHTAFRNIFDERIASLGTSYDLYDIGLLNRSIDLENDVGLLISERLQTSIGDLELVDIAKIETIIDQSIIGTMKDITTEENEDMEVLHNQKNENMGEFNEIMQGYDPMSRIKSDEISRISSDLMRNNMTIARKVDGKKEDYVAYADKANETAVGHVNTLEEKIQEENEASNQQVVEGLSSAKESRAIINGTNEVLLTDFIAKLPYSRLGNGPSASAYEFIVEPARFKTTSMAPTKDADPSVVSTEIKSLFHIQDISIVVLGIVMFIVVVFIIRHYRLGVGKIKMEKVEH